LDLVTATFLPLAADRSLAVLLSEHGIDHLHDEALLGFGESLDALHLLLQLRVGPRLPGLASFSPIRASTETASAWAMAGRRETGTRRRPTS
jgi:hypothetical protein